jgi:hypothetical protein
MTRGASMIPHDFAKLLVAHGFVLLVSEKVRKKPPKCMSLENAT